MGSTLDRRTTPRQCSRGVAQGVRQGSLGRWPLARARNPPASAAARAISLATGVIVSMAG